MFMVAFGDPFNGLTLHGPFQSAEDALEYANTEAKGAPFWVGKSVFNTTQEQVKTFMDGFKTVVSSQGVRVSHVRHALGDQCS
jgi:hypothetical protein